MKRLCVVSALAVASTVAGMDAASIASASPAIGKSKEWTIEPPAGWEEDVAAGNALRDQMAALVPKNAELEVRIWGPEEPGQTLAVQWYLLPLSGKARDMIDALDRGVVKSMTRSTTIQDQSSRSVDSMVIREARVDSFGGTKIELRIVRRYQPAVDGLHALIAMCGATARSSACDAAIDGMQFQVSDPIGLDDSGAPLAFLIGEFLGVLLVVGVPLWIALAIRKRWRARGEAVKAAARPGSPPGPGGAAGGT